MTPQEYQDEAVKRVYGNVPPFALVGSPPKVGKTTDSLYTLPNAMYLFSDGGLKPAVGVVGWAPLDTDSRARTLTEGIKAITERIKAGDPKKGLQFKNEAGQTMWGVVIDDFSLKAKAEVAFQEANPSKTADGKVNKFAIWNNVNAQTNRVITICRELGMPAYLSAHLREPGIDEDTKWKIPGGPDVASKGLSTAISAWVDYIVYVVDDPTRIRWPHGLSANSLGGNWLAGDRHNIVTTGAFGQPMSTPLNTAEVFRAAGYTLPRPVGMEWCESMVVFGADQILVHRKPDSVVFQDVINAVKARVPNLQPWQAIWMLRDIADRVEIRQKSQRFNPLLAWNVTL